MLRLPAGCTEERSAAVLDSRTLRSTPEGGGRAAWDGYKRTRGSKLHRAVFTDEKGRCDLRLGGVIRMSACQEPRTPFLKSPLQVAIAIKPVPPRSYELAIDDRGISPVHSGIPDRHHRS